MQIKKRIDDEACFHFFRRFAHERGNLFGVLALFRTLCGIQNEQRDARGKIAGIDHIHVFKLRRSGAGVLVAAGKITADIKMDHRVVIFPAFFEKCRVIAHVHGSRAAHALAGAHVVENLLRRDVHAVATILPALFNVQRRNADIILFDELRRQVACAVRRYFNPHCRILLSAFDSFYGVYVVSVYNSPRFFSRFRTVSGMIFPSLS